MDLDSELKQKFEETNKLLDVTVAEIYDNFVNIYGVDLSKRIITKLYLK